MLVLAHVITCTTGLLADVTHGKAIFVHPVVDVQKLVPVVMSMLRWMSEPVREYMMLAVLPLHVPPVQLGVTVAGPDITDPLSTDGPDPASGTVPWFPDASFVSMPATVRSVF